MSADPLRELARLLQEQREREATALESVREDLAALDRAHDVMLEFAAQIEKMRADEAALVRWFHRKRAQIRAAVALAKADPRHEHDRLTDLVRQVELIIRECAAGHGAKGGAMTGAKRRMQFDEAGGVSARRAKWETLRGSGKAKSVCDRLTAKAFGVTPATVANMRSRSKTRGDPWAGNDQK